MKKKGGEWPCAVGWQRNGEEENEKGYMRKKDLKRSGMERRVTKVYINELSLSTQICMNIITKSSRRVFVL